MEPATLQIQMLGRLSIRYGGREINDHDNRSRKLWLLIAYMIYCRNRRISQDELIELIWGDDGSTSNPVNALKTMFHRVRSLLNQLGDSMGYTLIIRRQGSYEWNTEFPFKLDIDEFESLCKAGTAASNKDESLSKFSSALALYSGDFLPKLASEAWVIPITAYFHNLYIQTVQSTIELLESRGQLQEAVLLCSRAIKMDPYDEELYRHLMQNLLDLGDKRGAAEVYQNMNELMSDNFGVTPSEELRTLYREAVRTANNTEISPCLIQEQLKEQDHTGGAMFCDYDFFKVIYHAAARMISRGGDAVHICLLTVSGQGEGISMRSLDTCMDNLQHLIFSNLRKGDVVSRCSISQYIIMLPNANFENSCAVMDRIVKAFTRKYPHSPSSLYYSVQPLEPIA